MPHSRETAAMADKRFDTAALLRRAALQLASGDALNAQRTTRTVEQLILLQGRLQRRAQADTAQSDERERTLESRQRELDTRHAALNQREFDLACEAQRLDELKESLEALYVQMYNKKPD